MNVKRLVLSPLGNLILLGATCCWPSSGAEPDGTGWPMLAHDVGRSGATATEIRPPFARKWYRLFPDEGLMAGVQPVVADGKVYVGTMAGVLHAIDDATGQDVWAFKAGGPILHTVAAACGKVFFGAADARVYAVDAADGRLAWTVPTGAAVWNSPAVHQGLILIGSRDGKLYAIDADSGKVGWTGETGGPLLCSPAVDAKALRVYVGSEDMHVYAFGLRDGRRVWQSAKLPGVSLRGYYPVIAPDGSVMITVMPARSLDDFSAILDGMVKEVFGDYASWRHTKEENARLREANFKLMEKPETYRRQIDYLRKRLADQPQYQTFFVLDPASGRQKLVAPIVYGESMNGTGAPALVATDGKVVVKYQALLRSRYEHYSPFLNVGYLDTTTGEITPIMDQSRTYGWHDSLLLVHDEQCQLSLAGRVLMNTHQDNVNAMDLDTLQGFGEPFCQNIHEPQPGEAIGIWTYLLRGQPVPVGKEWLARGTAVYGGGSVIDVPVSIAGDTFYYVPTHEINAGAAVIAYRMQPGGTAAQRSPTPDAKLAGQQWQRVQQMPWDWDTLEMGRLDHVLKALPAPVPGTRRQPLTDEAAAKVATIADVELDRFVWEAASVEFATGQSPSPALRMKLAESVRALISRQWRPLVFPAGKHPTESYRFFVEPTETLYALARAYPYLDAELQREVRQYVSRMSDPGGPLEGPTGRPTYRPNVGEFREFYGSPEDEQRRVQDDITRSELARLYPLWLWAHVSGDWSKIQSQWQSLRDLAGREPNKMEEDCHNGHVAGLIAYCRMARQMEDQESLDRGLAKARQAMRDRLVHELAHPRGGLTAQVPTLRSIFARWRHLTPEVGRLCASYARQIDQHLMEVYVDYHRPTWWLAWNVETLWRNESPVQFPTVSAEVFDARAMVLGEPAEKLEGFLDIPWCKADLFYIQKLVHCIEAQGRIAWQDTHRAGPGPWPRPSRDTGAKDSAHGSD